MAFCGPTPTVALLAHNAPRAMLTGVRAQVVPRRRLRPLAVESAGIKRAGPAAKPTATRGNASLAWWRQKLESRMNPSINKRQKERDRQDRQRAKAELRKQRREAKNSKAPLAPGEDPDIAGIVPGPQAPADE
jgi:hypothetical protein